MTPLEIIKDAYDRAGIGYVVRQETPGGYFYLVTCDPRDKAEYERMRFHEFTSRGFMEFTQEGEVASY
jgi:hypothetical protein